MRLTDRDQNGAAEPLARAPETLAQGQSGTGAAEPAAPGASEGRAYHVLHVLDHSLPLHSGYAFRTLAILRQQQALGWRTSHLTGPKQTGCEVLEEEVEGWPFYRTPALNAAGPPGWREWRMVAALERRLVDLARRLGPDVLHAHSPALNAMAAIRAGRRTGIPVVYEVRAFWEDAAVDHGTAREGGLRYRLTRGLETWALRRVDAVTTICEGLRHDILARGLAADCVTVIPNAVDVEQFRHSGQPEAALRESLGLGADARVLGFIGSFYRYEGLDILLQALPAILREAPDVRILLVGGGPQEEHLRRLAVELGIDGQVVFTGRVPHSEVGRYYDLVDVLVYPRIAIRLTDLVTPLKPLEAMAQGRLLAASDVGGHRELIRDGETGVLFRAGDPGDLARRVLQLLSAEAEWPRLRRQARHFVEAERCWPVSVGRYRSVYERVTRGRPKS